jgi:hypothetical protein
MEHSICGEACAWVINVAEAIYVAEAISFFLSAIICRSADRTHLAIDMLYRQSYKRAL